MFWAQSTTWDYIKAEYKLESLSYSAHKSFNTNHNISSAQLFQTYTHSKSHMIFPQNHKLSKSQFKKKKIFTQWPCDQNGYAQKREESKPLTYSRKLDELRTVCCSSCHASVKSLASKEVADKDLLPASKVTYCLRLKVNGPWKLEKLIRASFAWADERSYYLVLLPTRQATFRVTTFIHTLSCTVTEQVRKKKNVLHS